MIILRDTEDTWKTPEWDKKPPQGIIAAEDKSRLTAADRSRLIAG